MAAAERTASGPARKDLGQTGCGVEPCHAGQLGDPVYPNLAEATVPAYETGLAGRHRNSRG